MKIIVRDNLGKDVTYEREWYISTDGKIFFVCKFVAGNDGGHIVGNTVTHRSELLIG